MSKKKKERLVPYVCGLPHCQCRIALPDHGEMVRYPHRDLHGFRCNGFLLRYDLTEEGRSNLLARLFAKVRKQKRPG